ncbi:MAG: GIY-YIG nuclease family protein [Bacilli bacterium]|uniref:GIY-YIG nuclease family protein n=1 Tax=Clostridium sp. TaxID=1506 RepID=UPI002FCB012A
MYYVYIHTNKINNKKYCGYTNNPNYRWRSGGLEYRPPKGKENTRPFYNAIQKYGWDNFVKEIVFETVDIELAKSKEREIIKKLNLRDRKFGYNVAEGGNGGVIYITHPKGMLGKPQTDNSKQLARKRFTKNNPMHNGIIWGVTHNHPKGMLGHKHTKETKRQISLKLKGKTFSEERNQKISVSLSGVEKSEEHKKKLSETRKTLFKEGKLKANCSKKICLTFPGGEKEIFNSKKEFEREYKTSRTITQKIIKSKKPYVMSKCVTNELKPILNRLVGCTLEEIENTEVN